MKLYKRILAYLAVVLAIFFVWKVSENQKSAIVLGQTLEQTVLNQKTMVLKIAELEADVERLSR